MMLPQGCDFRFDNAKHRKFTAQRLQVFVAPAVDNDGSWSLLIPLMFLQALAVQSRLPPVCGPCHESA